jgi:hypothetical protein
VEGTRIIKERAPKVYGLNGTVELKYKKIQGID